jgi:hypothetical protein
MKKLLLLLLLSLGFVGSANSESNIQLPSEQAVREYLHSNLPSLKSLEVEFAVFEVEAKIETLAKQYRITIDEEEKNTIDMLIIEQRKEIERLNEILFIPRYVALSPSRDYGLFKNHLIFSVEIPSFGLEWTALPGWGETNGLFYTDGKSINYLYGDSRVSSLELLLKNEKLQFETVDPQALASFVSVVLFTHGNSSASVIYDMSRIFGGGYVIRRNEDSINEDCPFNLSDYKNVEPEFLSSEEQEFLKVSQWWARSGLLVSDYHECFGFSDQELTNLSHDELIEIAKKRGFDSLLDIVLPSLKREGDNWILEFTTLYGWKHEKRILRLHNITFSPEYKVSLKESVLSKDFYDRVPDIQY